MYILSKKVTGPSALPFNINHHANKNIVHAPKIPVVRPNDRIDIIIIFSLFVYYFIMIQPVILKLFIKIINFDLDQVINYLFMI
jgi:hypothetical protein